MFILRIKTDSADFTGSTRTMQSAIRSTLADVSSAVATKLTRDDGKQRHSVRDINGNKIGYWEWSPDD